MTDKPSPLAADTPAPTEVPLSYKIGVVVGAMVGSLIASAIIVFVTVVTLLGIGLSVPEFIGATLLLTYLRN